jgi:predicted RNase H-like nuclease
LDTDGRIVDERMLGSDEEITSWISQWLEGPAVVAIDAPLHVPNETGRRSGENEVGRVYGSRKAGPHSSNRTRLLALHGTIRGEVLAARLGSLGFADPWAGRDRTLLEVYPHPAIIEAFGLSERLIYKAKRGVGVAGRRAGLRRLAGLIEQLATADPPLQGPAVAIGDHVRGRALKAIEDQLDARMCAWIAAVWAHRPDRMRLFGDSLSGHIAIPVGKVI